MNLKKILAGILSLLITVTVSAQQKITLADALKSAEANYPALKQKQLLQQIGEENQKLLDASLYPQLNVAGQATYQSEVTEFNGFGQKPDNYNIGLEMRFPLTKFGTVATRKQLEQAQTNIAITQVDVDLQKVRERVTTLFGNILLQKQNIGILNVRHSDLDSQRRKVAVAVANGAVLKSNQLVLESEILSTEQRIDDVQATVNGLAKELSIITGLPVDINTQLELGDVQLNSQAVNRPELKALEEQKKLLDLQADLLKKETRPDLYAFGQGFYGRPGYNFLNNDLRVYGIGGVGISWNINNLFTSPKRKKMLDIHKQIIDKQEETFTMNLDASLASKQAEIAKYQDMISKDAQIVKNRQQIIRAAKSQLENGAITSTEYLTELNAENTAELNLLLHQVQLSVAIAQYNTLSGY